MKEIEVKPAKRVDVRSPACKRRGKKKKNIFSPRRGRQEFFELFR